MERDRIKAIAELLVSVKKAMRLTEKELYKILPTDPVVRTKVVLEMIHLS